MKMNNEKIDYATTVAMLSAMAAILLMLLS